MIKRFLSLLLIWSILCLSLIGYVLLPAFAQGERAGIYSCNLPLPNYGSLRSVDQGEVFGLVLNDARAIWNVQGIGANYSRFEWSHYFTATLTAVGVNGVSLRYSIYFNNLRDNPYLLYVNVYRIDFKGVIYDYPCVSFVTERVYLENIITYLRKI